MKYHDIVKLELVFNLDIEPLLDRLFPEALDAPSLHARYGRFASAITRLLKKEAKKRGIVIPKPKLYVPRERFTDDEMVALGMKPAPVVQDMEGPTTTADPGKDKQEEAV